MFSLSLCKYDLWNGDIFVMSWFQGAFVVFIGDGGGLYYFVIL